jgi:radical SAM-linked protein
MRITVLDDNSGGFAAHQLRDGTEKSLLVLVKFDIRGNLRFLSHAEVLKVFQRACIRAGIKMQYSQGFNPRPRLSLPLPRSVGSKTDDDLLCVRIDQSTGAQAHKSIGALCTSMKTKLSEQLPENFELVSVEVTKAKSAPQPRAATYVLAVRQEYVNEKLKAGIERVLASESVNVQRRIRGKDTRFKTQDSRLKSVDVRGFLESIELDERGILVECKISSAGSIRVEEILKLLELDVEKLAAPIRRTNVQFVTCDS